MSGLEILRGGGEVLPLSVWSPPSRGAAPPPGMPDEVTGDRDRFEATGSEDSLLSHVELAAGVVSSILRDFNLRKVEALSVEETLALLLQGTASVRQVFSSIFFFIVSVLLADFLFFGRWLLTRKAWQGGPALPRVPPGRLSLTRLRLLP